MKRFVFLVAITVAVLAVPADVAAQTTTSTATSESTSTGVGTAEAVVGSSNNSSQNLMIDQRSNFEQHRPVPDAVIGTPPPSADCVVHDGIGIGVPNFGAGGNRGRVIESCEAREDARSMLAVAQAAEATQGRGAGTLDVLAARHRLENASDRNQDAYAAARQQLGGAPAVYGPTQ